MSWNPGKKELELIAQGKIQAEHIPCDILMVNKEEWQMVESVHDALLSSVGQVIVTDGKRGGRVHMRKEYEYVYTSPEVKAVQETGAGDAFLVGYVSAHLLGRSVEECTDWGTKNAVAVIQHMGAKTGLLRRRDFAL
jgi:sugar/nucleoside kinase (ribokinase family)